MTSRAARTIRVAATLALVATAACDASVEEREGDGGGTAASTADASTSTGAVGSAAASTSTVGSTSTSTSTSSAGASTASSTASTSTDASSSEDSSSADSSSAESSGSGVTGLDIEGDVARYDYAFDLDTRVATASLTVGATASGNCFVAPCEPALTDATWGGADASSVTQSPTDVEICGVDVDAGSEVVVSAQTIVPEAMFLGLDVGYSTRSSPGGGTFSYLLSWIGGCDHFGPCDDDPSRLARFGFDVTHDPGTTVLCPGVRTTPSPGQTRCEIAGTPAPTYSAFAIAADDRWVASPLVSAAGVDVVFYEDAGGAMRESLEADEVAPFLEWIVGRWGPLPYGDELRVATAPTLWLGFEHPANIVLTTGLEDFEGPYDDTLMHVLMHEIVHQYAGDRTTLASELDFVWKEAIAEYVTYVWEDMARPAGEAASSLAYWDDIALQSSFYPRPEDDPPPPVDVFYTHVYGPGPMTLFVQLEDLIGRDAILAALDAFLSGSEAKSVADLQEALEAESGALLDVYFDKWVFGSGAPVWPAYAVTSAVDGPDLLVTVTQTNATDGNAHPAVVGLRVVTASGTTETEADFGLDPIGTSVTVIVPSSGAATSITVDPRHRLVNRGPAAVSPRPVWIF